MIKAIITDIEGTTSSLAFVKEVLFPYAREHMAAFVRGHRDETEVAQALKEARRAARAELDDEALIEQLLHWMDEDRKLTPLKTLQGLIWAAAYRDGSIKGHIYEDAVRNLRRWKEAGYRLYVFSSGSVFAQKLLFGHTEYGDLTGLFDDFFDTHVGAKRDPTAYQSIATSIGLSPAQVLFLSDIREELDAARQVGMYTTWLVREEAVNPAAEHPQVNDFDAIDL